MPMPSMESRDKRVGLHLAVEVQGQDATGRTFKETTRTLNISGGGILFESHHNLQIGARIVLRIDLPPALRKHFRGRARYHARAVVCRVEKLETETAARIGARFLGEVEEPAALR
jgi:c-di-GMP-binding flagellar brake protein YcgR